MSVARIYVIGEPEFLTSARLLMRPYERVWDLVFTASADEALNKMDRQRPDVLLTDIDVVTGNGESFDRQVFELYPSISTVLCYKNWPLTRSFRGSTRSLGFLAKPIDEPLLVWVLRKAVRDSLSMRMHGMSGREKDKGELVS